MEITYLLQLLICGLAIGAVYGLISLGFVLIYKSSGLLNIAQGELLLIGAFVCYSFSSQIGLPFYFSVLITLALSLLLGLLIERLLLRPMVSQPLISVVMMTIALAFFLRGLAMFIWGPLDRSYPQYLPTEPLSMWGLVIDQGYVWGFLIAATLLIIFTLYFRFTKSGLAMRATAEGEQTALAMGINVRNTYATAWAISCLTAAVGGIILGTMTSVGFMLSIAGLKVFPAVVVGGMDSIPGAVVGGVLIGVLESLAGGYLDKYLVGIKEVAPYIILLIILIIRPYGLFGLKRIERI